MRIIITGANGQLGLELSKQLSRNKEYEVICTDIEELNIVDINSVNKVISKYKPDVVINCAAHTAVDLCETDIENAYKINAIGPRNLAIACEKVNAKFVQVSTDYVFDGTKDGEYTENDETNPINIYGESKLAGEKYVQEILDKYYIVRTSWVFNINGKNFIETMLRLSKANNQLSIVNDQIGSPTYTKDLSRLLVDMLETSKYGLYHATNEGYCSWYEFANTIFKLANINIDIKAINSNEYASRAKRPLNSKLSKDKLIEYGFKPLPHWEDALKDYLIRRRDLLI